jgi:hypothetical protein
MVGQSVQQTAWTGEQTLTLCVRTAAFVNQRNITVAKLSFMGVQFPFFLFSLFFFFLFLYLLPSFLPFISFPSHTHTHTDTHIRISTFIKKGVCVCVSSINTHTVALISTKSGATLEDLPGKVLSAEHPNIFSLSIRTKFWKPQRQSFPYC